MPIEKIPSGTTLKGLRHTAPTALGIQWTQSHHHLMRITRLALTIIAMSAAVSVLHAAGEPPVIPLWPDGAPGSEGKTNHEVVAKSASGEVSVWSIHNPSLTAYLPPKEKATRAAMLV